MNAEHFPAVSIIMAAYNRSNVLRYAIASVLNSSFSDWELLVIGDACTDDTGEVVASFGDPRIQFFNLEENSGNQSSPNNAGFIRARGHYIAYLNQDDLWFPDHLEKAMEALEKTGADWVFSMGIVFFDQEGAEKIFGAVPEGIFNPRWGQEIVASFWVLKKKVLDEIGGWRDYHEILIPPSQDLLIRAWKAGKDIRMVPALTAVHLPSGVRKNSYANRDYLENKEYFERMCSEKNFRENELLKLIYNTESSLAKESLNVHRSFRRLGLVIFKRIGLMFGIMPVQIIYRIVFKKKGKFINKCRTTRGL